MGEERAETYLRLLAEAELRRTGDQLRDRDATAGTDGWLGPGLEHATAERALWKVVRAGRILVAVGALDQDYLDRVEADLLAAIRARSRLLLNHDRRRGMVYRNMYASPASPPLPSRPGSRAMRVTPIGRALRVVGGRAPSALHLMSLVRTGTEAVITVVVRMQWPPGGSSAELEITGAGPHHLPYDQLWAVDDQGTRYAVRFEDDGKGGGPLTWRGIARLSPVPPRGARRLDLIGDGTPLIQLALRPPAARGYPAARGHPIAPPATEPTPVSPGERLLVLEAERILASGDASGPVQLPGTPGEMITVLIGAGAIAAGSQVPGQLAALCQRLGAAGHGITAPPAAQIPVPWASVIAHRGALVPAGSPEVFAPLACILPDVDGTRFALAGLSTAAGESHLHVVGSGMPPPTDRFANHWTPGFSWWLRDGAGNWHVATPGESQILGDGTQAFRLGLTPPLAAVPDTAEIVVTGPATRVRATIPIRPAPEQLKIGDRTRRTTGEPPSSLRTRSGIIKNPFPACCLVIGNFPGKLTTSNTQQVSRQTTRAIMKGIRLARRALVIVVTASVLGLPAAMSASAGTTELPRQAGLATLMKSYGSRYKDLIGNSFWQAAIAQSTVEAYDQATRKKSYLRDIAATYRTYVHGPNPLSRLPDFEDRYTDDTAWWGLAWLQAYVMTKNKNYLRVAEADANFIHRQWDTQENSCGGRGGVWWVSTRAGERGRLAVSNALFLELTAWLHNVLHHDTKYLRWAEAEWAWLGHSGLIDRHNHLVWNGFSNAPECVIGGPYWSYDMGGVMAGLAQLYRATKKASLLTEAEKIADATIRYLAPHGVLADKCQPKECDFDEQSFKGIFVGDLRMLATIARTSAYNSFLRAQRFSVEAHDTSTGEKFGLMWAGPIRKACPSSTTRSHGAAANVCTSYTQASAEAAVVAALRRR